MVLPVSFVFSGTATTEIYTLSLHDALPIFVFYQQGLGLKRLRDGAPCGWHPLGDWQADGGSTGFFGELENRSDADEMNTCASPEDHGVIFYTSGTIAKPKGVIQSHANAFYNYDYTADYLQLAPGDRVLDCRSYSWMSAQHMSPGAPLVAGATNVMSKTCSQSK